MLSRSSHQCYSYAMSHHFKKRLSSHNTRHFLTNKNKYFNANNVIYSTIVFLYSYYNNYLPPASDNFNISTFIGSLRVRSHKPIQEQTIVDCSSS